MVMPRFPCVVLATIVALASCARPEPPGPPADDDRVRALADTYLNAWFDRNPDQITYFGIPNRRHDRLPDNSAAALKAWEEKENVWLADAKAIDPAHIQDASLKATYAIVREALEGSIAERVCRNELWGVSQMTGWQVSLGYLVTIQPVGSDQARMEALARWSSLAGYLDTEIANLREGLRLKYSAPRRNVQIVINQIDGLIVGKGADQPFLSPAERDKSPEFKIAYNDSFKRVILPAFTRYRDFLEQEYLPAARAEIAVAENPNGADCYRAAVRRYSTLSIAPQDVHQIGLKQIDLLMAEMKTIAER